MVDGTRPRLWLLVSCGWGFRNYVRSDLLERLLSFADVTLFLPPDGDQFHDSIRQRGCSAETLFPVHLPRRLALLHGILVNATNFRLGFWDPYLWQWTGALQSGWKRPFYWAQQWASKAAGQSLLYQALRDQVDRRLRRLVKRIAYQGILNQERPCLVISCNPYNLSELPASLLALDRGIPVLASVISWDNLTYLGPLMAEYSHHAVWGPAMKEDLQLHLSRAQDVRIAELGSPQFDYHVRKDLEWSREQFFQRILGDPRRKLLVYAANPHELFWDEPDIASMILDAIRRGRIPGNPQLLVRVHPHDVTGRFEPLKQRYPELILQTPWPHTTSHSWWFTPSLDDLALQSNTLRHSEVLINTASSMTLDAAIFDTPVVNVAFAPRPNDPLHRRVPHYHQSKHYSRIDQARAVRMAFSLDELISHINTYLEDPSLDRPRRRQVVDQICGPVDGRSIERLAALAGSLVAEGKSVLRAAAPDPGGSNPS